MFAAEAVTGGFIFIREMCQKRLSHLFGLEIKRDTLSNIIERYERSLFFSPNSVKTAFITTSTFF